MPKNQTLIEKKTIEASRLLLSIMFCCFYERLFYQQIAQSEWRRIKFAHQHKCFRFVSFIFFFAIQMQVHSLAYIARSPTNKTGFQLNNIIANSLSLTSYVHVFIYFLLEKNHHSCVSPIWPYKYWLASCDCCRREALKKIAESTIV